jgi:hypothetical protein
VGFRGNGNGLVSSILDPSGPNLMMLMIALFFSIQTESYINIMIAKKEQKKKNPNF